MTEKPTYEEFEQRVKDLEKQVSGHERAEEALQASESLHHLYFDNASDVIYSVDPEFKIINISPSVERMLGYKPEELIDRSFQELNLVAPEYLEQAVSDTMRVLGGERISSAVYQFIARDGKKKWGEVSGAPLIRDGQIVALVSVARDITKRKQAEEALRESEEKYRQLFNHAPAGIYEVDFVKQKFVNVNDVMCEYTGYTREEMLSMRPFDILIEESKKVFTESIGKLFAGETIPETVELKVRGKNGREFWILLNSNFLYENGKPKGATVVVHDITARKQVEGALRESEKRYRSLFEESPISLWEEDFSDVKIYIEGLRDSGVEDLEGYFINHPETVARCMNMVKLIDVNKATLEMYDAESKAEFWDNIGSVFGEDWYDVFSEALCVLAKGETIFEGEAITQMLKGDKNNIALKWSVAPDYEETWSKVLVAISDITDRKQAEEALRVSEDKFRSMSKSMKDPVYMCSQDFRIEYMNPSMIRRTGYDATGEKCFKAVHELNEKCPWCMYDRIRQGEHYEVAIVSPKDNRSYHVSSSPIVHGDGSISKMTVFRDTTDLKTLEAQLQQAQKMEAMGTLAGGIAHDFNNLLMAIQGRASIMLMKKDSSHPDIRHLKGIENDIESAADLTRQLLGFARGGKYEVRPTDFNEVIKKQNRMFGRTKKEISIRGKYEKDLWSVEVDRGQFEQVLLNLYVNAWQAMPGGGDLYLKTENVTINRTDVKPFSIEPGRYVKISVTDTGVGMDKKTREKIFEPFFTTKEMGRGTGLGLASAYGIIKNHGGFINVYSEKGHGATFNIYLPASEKEVIEEKKPAGETVRGTETVLFVDDEDMIIEIAEKLFEGLGYKVLTAGSGREAIETYEKNKERIDMVLLDMVMPDMSGGETYDKLKKINPGIKVLLASGYSMNGTATEIMDRGCSGFIQKPFKMKELSQKLREVLDEK